MVKNPYTNTNSLVPTVKQIIVKFDDDEDNGKTPNRRVPARYVIPLPESYFYDDCDDIDLSLSGPYIPAPTSTNNNDNANQASEGNGVSRNNINNNPAANTIPNVASNAMKFQDPHTSKSAGNSRQPMMQVNASTFLMPSEQQSIGATAAPSSGAVQQRKNAAATSTALQQKKQKALARTTGRPNETGKDALSARSKKIAKQANNKNKKIKLATNNTTSNKKKAIPFANVMTSAITTPGLSTTNAPSLLKPSAGIGSSVSTGNQQTLSRTNSSSPNNNLGRVSGGIMVANHTPGVATSSIGSVEHSGSNNATKKFTGSKLPMGRANANGTLLSSTTNSNHPTMNNNSVIGSSGIASASNKASTPTAGPMGSYSG